ncbi:MAG: hypothetical protein FJ109_05750 [Deltaproteobacteria bacterium]|nr:hypothetical protein [Deltaproteobacteria bacterium]
MTNGAILVGVAFAAAAAVCAGPLHAQEGTEGTVVDVFRGPVISSSRVLGMGGAYTGVAEGTQGGLLNTASLASRYAWSTDWFDWDFNVDWLILVPGTDADVDNDGRYAGEGDGYLGLNLGAGLQFGNLGVGLWLNSDTFSAVSGDDRLTYGFTYGYLGAAYAFLREQLVVGAGLGGGGLQVTSSVRKGDSGGLERWTDTGSVKWNGSGVESGALWRPLRLPIRLGASIRLPILIDSSKRDDLDGGLASVPLPDSVRIPWRVATGFSIYHSFGGYSYNKSREAEAASAPSQPSGSDGEAPSAVRPKLNRRYLLAAVDLGFCGPSPAGAVGAAPFVGGERTESGRQGSVSVHAGLESEVWSNRLVVRGGSYLEPARLEGSEVRAHGTFGMDVRLFSLLGWDLRAGTSFDLAPRYYNWGLGIGFWH